MRNRIWFVIRTALVCGCGLVLSRSGVYSQVLGNGPTQLIWRTDFQNGSFKYHASTVIMDGADNLFVGGSVGPPMYQEFPWIAKFDKAGSKQWEYWVRTNVVDLFTVDGMTSDGRGGIYAALRIASGGLQTVRIDATGNLDYLESTTNYATSSGFLHEHNSVHLAADGRNGFYLLGLFALPEDRPIWQYVLSRYDQSGQILWRTNLFRGFFGDVGLDRSLVLSSNHLYFCGLSDSGSRLVKVGENGAIEWSRDSIPFVYWSRLATMDDGTLCVSGNRNYEVWSANGQRLASHGAWGFCTVARQTGGSDGFLVSDCHSADLALLDSKGVIRKLGQLPVSPAETGPPEIVNLSADEWLVAVNCQEGFLYTNNLSLFEFGPNGELKWRQRLPGFEYQSRSGVEAGVPEHWLLKASDGTIRLAVNLSLGGANPKPGVGVAAFSLTNNYTVPTLSVYPAFITNQGVSSVQLRIDAENAGSLSYEWHFAGIPLYGETNATLAVTSPGVYCARVMDANGEMVSPAISVVRQTDSYQRVTLGQNGVVNLTFMPGIAVQFQVGTSTNLLDWAIDPVVYSWVQELPSTLVSFPGPTPTSAFFRPFLLPAP
ncbi:MAG TPA: hypothetical protein VKY92_15720 [Verrucomicrobiae bacterium]|nr:hypothetical protein [Verrucomicrobiae bacterium]